MYEGKVVENRSLKLYNILIVKFGRRLHTSGLELYELGLKLAKSSEQRANIPYMRAYIHFTKFVRCKYQVWWIHECLGLSIYNWNHT